MRKHTTIGAAIQQLYMIIIINILMKVFKFSRYTYVCVCGREKERERFLLNIAKLGLTHNKHLA